MPGRSTFEQRDALVRRIMAQNRADLEATVRDLVAVVGTDVDDLDVVTGWIDTRESTRERARAMLAARDARRGDA